MSPDCLCRGRSGDVVIAPMTIESSWTHSFLRHPYAWVDVAIFVPSVDIILPDSIPKFLGIVARDHLAAADDSMRGSYSDVVHPPETYVFYRCCASAPNVTIGYLQDRNRSISCSASRLQFSHSIDQGLKCHSLTLADVSIDAPHQHVLTRVFYAGWTDGDNQITEECISGEQSESGSSTLHLVLPRCRAVLFADAIMSIKSVIDNILEVDDMSKQDGLDDIMEEPTPPRGGDSVLDEWGFQGEDSPVSNAGQESEDTIAHTRSIIFTAREAEIVIPETRRTDLLLFNFSVRGEHSNIFNHEIRFKLNVKNLSASMGHWDSTKCLDSASRYANLHIDSYLLRDFVTTFDYLKWNKAESSGVPVDKGTLVIRVGVTHIVASADQMYSSTGMIEHLIDEFLDDDEEHNPAVFAADDFGLDADVEFDGYDDFADGSVVSAGRSALSRGRSAHSSRHSDYTDGMSDGDWQTVGSESDHGSYAMRSKHSTYGASARSSGGSSDGETESVGGGTFHSAEDDQYAHELFSGSQSRLSWERASDTHTRTSSGGSDTSRKPAGERRADTPALASVFGLSIELPINLTMKMTCPTMNITLTSDPFGQVTPLWLMQVDEVSFLAKSVSSTLTLITAQASVQLKYFNLSVLCWESAVEPMLLSMDGNNSAGLWTVDVRSEHNLNCNVSEALLQALEQVTDTSKSGPNSSTVQTAPYKLINTTGASIVYSIGLNEYTDSKPMVLATGETAEYKVDEVLRSERNTGDFAARYITFSLEGTATESICIDKPAEHMLVLQNPDSLPLESDDGSASVRARKAVTMASTSGIGIVCQVSKGETKGTRQIVVGSSITVQNATNVPLAVMAESPHSSGQQVTECMEVQPGDTEFVPVHFTSPNSGSTLRVRPVLFGEESNWSQPFDMHYQAKEGPCQQDMVCTYEDTHKGAFCVAAAMSILPGDSIQRKVITLFPKLAIANLLPVALDYRFIDRSGTRVMQLDDASVSKLSGIMIDDDGEIVTNDMSADLHHMESFDEWLLQVKLGDHELWSTKVPIRVGLRRVVVQNDETEEQLQLIVRGTLSSKAALRVTISCPYWIINKTVDELQTRPWSGVKPRSKARKRALERVTKLYPDQLAPFSCETDRFCVQMPGFDWSSGISLEAVGTTDFFLQQPAETPRAAAEIDSTVNPLGGSIESGWRPPAKIGKAGCQIGLNISSGTGPLSKTKIFTFMPFFRLDNQIGEDLLVRQSFQEHELLLRSDMHDMSFQWSDMRSSKRVQLRFVGEEWAWSGGIDITQHRGEFFIPLSKKRDRKATRMRTRDYIVRGEVKNTEQGSTHSMRMIVLNKEDDKFPPYLLLNACSEVVKILQVGTDRTIVVQSGTVRPYACEEPFLPHVIEVWIGDAQSMSLRLVGEQAVDIGLSHEVTADVGSEGMQQLRVRVDCSGPVTRVRVEQTVAPGNSVQSAGAMSTAPVALPTFELRSASSYITAPMGAIMDDTNNAFSMQRLTSLTGEVRKRGKDLLAGAKDLALEVGDIVKGELVGSKPGERYKIARLGHGTRQGKNIGFSFASVRVSFIGNVDTKVAPGVESGTSYPTVEGDMSSRKEIILVVLDDVRAKVVTNENQQKAELSVRHFQVDNQSHETKFPVLLSVATADSTEDCIVFHVDRSEFNDRIEYFDYAALQVKDEIHIQLEQEWVASTSSFLSRLQDKLFGTLALAQQPEAQSGLGVLFGSRNLDDVADVPGFSKNLYFDILRMEPVRIRMDLSASSQNSDTFMSLPNISNLTIRIAELQMKSPYGSAKRIVKDEIFAHYKRHYNRALYKVLGYKLVPHDGLIDKLVRGVFDCIRTPIVMTRREVQLVQDGNAGRAVVNFFTCQGGFFRGVCNGTLIFANSIVGGVTHAFGSFIEGMSTILVRGAFNDKFNLRRRNLMRVKPRHILDGILLAVIIALNAVMSTVSWVFRPFVELLYERSIIGFFKATILAVLGVVLQPIAGALDALTMLIYGVAETLSAYVVSLQAFGATRKKTEKSRKRQPRLFDVNGQLRPVNSEESMCQDILTQLGFTNEVFVDKVRLQEYMVIITSARIILYLWNEKKRTSQKMAGKYVYSAVAIGLGIGFGTGGTIGGRIERVGLAKGVAFGIAVGIFVGLTLAIVRILYFMQVKWNSLFQVSKLILQSNFQWQISWNVLEAVALELPTNYTSRAEDEDIDGRNSPRRRNSLNRAGGTGATIGEAENRSDTQSPPKSGDEGTQEARLRFRLRPRPGCLPGLVVNQSGTVANFSGLTLQATNPANFMWDTIRSRRTRQIMVGASTEAADGLDRLYRRLATLKGGRHQRQLRAEGKLARVLEHVLLTDQRVDSDWHWLTPVLTGVRSNHTSGGGGFVRVAEDQDDLHAGADDTAEAAFSGRAPPSRSTRMKEPLFLAQSADGCNVEEANASECRHLTTPNDTRMLL
eukprot:COSAG01_NODE_1841_length_9077_cov_3.062709_2_plen_2431_part_00